eukprot:1101140-Alexandrium_andersonii.AAC.1
MHVGALRVLRPRALAELLVVGEEPCRDLEPPLEDLSPVLRFPVAPLGAYEGILHKSKFLLGLLSQTGLSGLGLDLDSLGLSL